MAKHKSQKSTPDYIIKMRSKDGDQKGWSRVGVAWQGDHGLHLKLNRGTVLDWHDFADDGNYTLMLFANEDQGD